MDAFKFLSDEELVDFPPFTSLEAALEAPDMCYELDLNGGQVGEADLHAAIPKLPRLQILVLQNNHQVRHLPASLGELKHLSYLELRNCGVEDLPDSLAACTLMTDLVVSECPHFRELPDFVGNWPEMIYLEVNGTQVEALPASIGQLSQLEELNVNQNKLHALPDSLGQLKALQVLRTYGNYGMYLSAPVFSRLTSLQKFDHGLVQFTDGTLEEVQAALPNCKFAQITKYDPIYQD